jgi:hypothetical protein
MPEAVAIKQPPLFYVTPDLTAFADRNALYLAAGMA